MRPGINPAAHGPLAQIKREQASAATFKDLAEEWCQQGLDTRDQSEAVGMLGRVVLPRIGSGYILDVMSAALRNYGPAVAAEARCSKSGAFDLTHAPFDFNTLRPVRPQPTQAPSLIQEPQVSAMEGCTRRRLPCQHPVRVTNMFR